MSGLRDMANKLAQELKDKADGIKPVEPNRAEKRKARAIARKLKAAAARRKHEGRRPPRG